jgi:hypothetical protein
MLCIYSSAEWGRGYVSKNSNYTALSWIGQTDHFIPDIGAFPDSVNVLEGVSGDVRTPEKLVDGVNNTLDGRHMWLAPILPNQVPVYFSYWTVILQ